MQLLFCEHRIYLRHVSCLFRPLLTTNQLKNFRNPSWILLLVYYDDICLLFTSTLGVNRLSILTIHCFLGFAILLSLNLFKRHLCHLYTCFVLLYDHSLDICICLARVFFRTLSRLLFIFHNYLVAVKDKRFLLFCLLS